MKRLFIFLVLTALLLTGCQGAPIDDGNMPSPIEGTEIVLGDSGITVDGAPVTSDITQAVYAANDIVFYLADQGFTYGEGTEADEHEQSEADAHTVVHITQPGTYLLSGKLSAGQVAVDLGEDAEDDPSAVVTLVLNNVDIACTVAPAIIFYEVYECGSTDETLASKSVDTSAAGANIIIADGTHNRVDGSYVARIYKSYELSEDGTEVIDSKKLHKYDGAFYSKKSMNINGGKVGDGVLDIIAENEGLDSELHLTINGGIINITSGNDGINTNEDYISVTTINGGSLNINVLGTTGEGDGIDSNGWLVINGGSVTAAACSSSGDAGIDSDMGIHINGGTICASGHMLDTISNGNGTFTVFSFASPQSGGNTYTLKNSRGESVGTFSPVNDFTYLIISGDFLVADDYTFWLGDTQLANGGTGNSGGMGGMRPEGGFQRPDSMQFPEGTEMPKDFQHPEGTEILDGIEFPEGMERPDGMPGMTPPSDLEGAGEISGASTVFTITAGDNYFSSVAPVTQAQQ